ncbi:MAG: FadR/GntR family transcriptional regulator [Clostridium sp.]
MMKKKVGIKMYSARTTKTKCDMAVDEILGMIIKGEYKENDKLPPEQYFMDYFGMSRVTIRECFKKLSILGVVEICQGKGTFVKKVDINTLLQPLYSTFVVNNLSISQIFDARICIEYGTTMLAVENATKEQLIQLEELMKEFDKTIIRRDSEEFSRLDVMFHEMIADMSGNYIMAAMYKMIKEILSQYICKINLTAGVIENSQKQHRDILKAMQERDADRASELMKQHIKSVEKRLKKQVEDGLAPAYIK